MPKSKKSLSIRLDLLKPQSNPEKIPFKLLHWLLSSGRYIFVFVEALVLIAFLARFKLDADLAAKKEAIEEQIPYIESLRPYEILIRNTQLKLETIHNLKRDGSDWAEILKKISDQIPISIKIISINMTKNLGNNSIHINGQTQINSDISAFVAGLKEETSFSNVSIAGLGMEQGIIKFTIDLTAKNSTLESKKL